MGMGMDGFRFCCGPKQFGQLRQPVYVRFFCKRQIFSVGLAFTGKRGGQIFLGGHGCFLLSD